MGRLGLRHRDVLSGLRGPRVAAGVALVLASLGSARADVPAAPAPSTTPSTTAAEPAAPHAVVGPVLVPPLAVEKSKELLRRVQSTDPWLARSKELESALREAAQDLGLAVDLGTSLIGDGMRDLDLVNSAAEGRWAISPRLEPTGSDSFVLRLYAVPPKSTTVLLRVEKVDGKLLATRAVVMLRDFVQMKLGGAPSKPGPDDAEPRPEEEAGRSRGRPVLAASSTLLGLYSGYAMYQRSGSSDPRLLYPLLALGAGVGLGASLLAAEEWDLTHGVAWTLAAGGWWGAIAGFSLAAGRKVEPESDRPAFGLLGGLLGTTVAITGLTITRYDEGDAAIVHSGAALGLLFGSSLDLLGHGTLKSSPSLGIGLGTGLGLVGGGALAAVLTTSVQRVMLIDLGALLGALGGASLASPLVFRDETSGRARVFLSAVMGGTLVGGAIGFFATRETKAIESAPATKAQFQVFPTVGPGSVGLMGTF